MKVYPLKRPTLGRRQALLSLLGRMCCKVGDEATVVWAAAYVIASALL